MYYATCPYCGKLFKGVYRDVVKEDFKTHVIELHYYIVLNHVRTKTKTPFGDKTSVKWYAGILAANAIQQ